MTQVAKTPGHGTRAWLRFRLRTLLLAVLLFGVAGAIVSWKLQQDYRIEAAFRELRALGMHDTIRAMDNHRVELVLRSDGRALSDRDVERLHVALELLQRPHDLGLSTGLVVSRVDLTGCELSLAALEKLRQVLPDAEILH